MPSSKYVYTDDNQRKGTMPTNKSNNRRRRSQRIRKQSLEKVVNNNNSNSMMDDNDTTILDPDETTMLDEDKDETILLSDEDIGGEIMDVDEKYMNMNMAPIDSSPPASTASSKAMSLRGGAATSGFLTNDPLTSSTMKSTPFSMVRARARAKANAAIGGGNAGRGGAATGAGGGGGGPTMNKKMSKMWDSDDSDTDLSENEFLREVQQRQAERKALLEESKMEQESQQQQPAAAKTWQTSFAGTTSFGNDSTMLLETQDRPEESEETTRMANHGVNNNNSTADQQQQQQQQEESLSESFAATQPWEKELGNLPSYSKHNDNNPLAAPQKKDGRRDGRKINDHAAAASRNQQNAPQKNHHRRQESEPSQYGKQSATTNRDNQRDQSVINEDQASSRDEGSHHFASNNKDSRHNAPQKNRRSQEEVQARNNHQGRPGEGDASNSLPNHPQRQQYQHEEEESRSNNNYQTQPNHHRGGNHPANNRTTVAGNPYQQKQQPPPPTKKMTTVTVPKISLEHLKSGKKKSKSQSRTNGSSHTHTSSSRGAANDGETWQEEAFRSSLLDLLGSFPSNYFFYNNQGDESMDHGNDSTMFIATSATEHGYLDENSPHSTASQSAASAQLNRKRLLDAASRSLARLAIASRHSTNKANNNGDRSTRSSGGSSDGISPDFNPPSPRSLPSYMSVMNVHDDSNSFDSGSGYWGRSSSGVSSSSTNNEVFSGHSVHGRSARSVQLCSIPPLDDEDPSSSPYSLWTVEQLAYGSMVIAAQVCYEASCDPNFDGNHSTSSEAESCRVAGFAQTSSGNNLGNTKRPAVSSALVESSLGFVATAFACLEADFVYSVVKSPMKTAGGGDSKATVFDALSQLAPVSSITSAPKQEEAGTIPVLSLLALSRGLEAALYVARYATSLDPSAACAAYSSPHYSCGGNSISSIDTGIDESGVGWLSALGRDLGLKLESTLGARPRHMHLSAVAESAYDFILDYNPMIVEDAAESFHGTSGRDKRGNSRGGLYVDTQAGQESQVIGGLVCRQSSVMTDRLYAANVEYLCSMLQSGIVSGWVSNAPSEGGDMNDSNGRDRTVEGLCQKLFFVIETRSRLRRSTNQSTSKNSPGDSEAVCVASLSLLILSLPKYARQSAPSSLSTSFRQMGHSTGTIEDLFSSPLVKKIVETALSWKDPLQRGRSSKESDIVTKIQAANAMYVLSDVCMAGGSSLITLHFQQQLEGFLQHIIESACNRGKSNGKDDCFDNSSIDCAISFLLQLHTGCPMLVRQALRNCFEQSSDGNDDFVSSFVSGLLRLSANKSFSASSSASALLRALIDGNPVDRTPDRLSEIILESLNTEHVGSTVDAVLRSLVEATYSSANSIVPNFSSRWHSRVCVLGDLFVDCTYSSNAVCIFAQRISSDEVMRSFAKAIESDHPDNIDVDTLHGSTKLSLLFLFARFSSNLSEASILDQQRHVKERLVRASNYLPVLEVAMAQGSSSDMTHRALKLQNSLLSLSDERSLALTFTKASNSLSRKENHLQGKLMKSEAELKNLVTKTEALEFDRDNLSNAFNDQRLSYERRLEWVKSEARMAARNVSEIHVHERKRAEEQCHEEHALRTRFQQENEQLKRQTMSDKSRIEELEALLEQERKSRQSFESALKECKNELSTTSVNFEKASNTCRELGEKLAVSEENVSDLTAVNEDAKTNLEDTCGKLIKLATIYQNKETEMDKYKADLRNAVNTANSHADTAIQKYEAAKQQNKSLKMQLTECSAELKEIKAHRANTQRMRKNAPVAYLNQLHKDPRIQGEKPKQTRRVRTGKENSFDAR